MALTAKNVGLAIVIHVVAEDGETGVAELPVRMPLPLIVVSVDVSEPAVRRKDVGFAIAVYVGDADAVAVLLPAANRMHLRR